MPHEILRFNGYINVIWGEVYDVFVKNGDVFDLRFENLIAKLRNGKKLTNKYIGVYRIGIDTWAARIIINGDSINLGRTKTPKEAAFIYDMHAYNIWGNDAKLNFPETFKRS